MEVNKTSCLAASCCCFVVLAVVGAYSAVLYNKFSPVYTDIECGDEAISITSVSASGFTSISARLSVTLTCKNPNPYVVKITDPKVGKMYHATDMRQLGVIVAKPGMIPEGGGEVVLDGEIKLSGFSAIVMIGHLLAGSVHVFLEVEFQCLIEQSLLVTSLKVAPMFEQKCGVTLDISGRETGDVVCGESFDDLVITEIGIKLKHGSASMGVDKEMIENATKDKNLYLSLAMAVSFSIMVMLVVGFSCVLYRSKAMLAYSKPPVVITPGLRAITVGSAAP